MKINTNPLSACCVFLIYLTVSLTYAEPIKIKPSTPLKANSLTKEADTSPQLNCAYLNKDSKQDSQSNSVGVLNFNISTKFNSKEKDLKVAKEILLSEGDSWGNPSFAYDNPNGGIIFGLWIEQDEGDIVTAREIYKYLPPSFSEEWGIESDKTKFRIDINPKLDINYVSVVAIGIGNGKLFGAGNKKPTLAVWYHIPIFYKIDNSYKVGVMKLYSRSPVECLKDSLNFLDEIVNNLEPKNVELISESNYIKNYTKKNVNTVKSTTPSDSKIQSELSINNSDSINNKLDNMNNKLDNANKELQELKILFEKLDNKLKK
jgi:hypothetical protein